MIRYNVTVTVIVSIIVSYITLCPETISYGVTVNHSGYTNSLRQKKTVLTVTVTVTVTVRVTHTHLKLKLYFSSEVQ